MTYYNAYQPSAGGSQQASQQGKPLHYAQGQQGPPVRFQQIPVMQYTYEDEPEAGGQMPMYVGHIPRGHMLVRIPPQHRGGVRRQGQQYSKANIHREHKQYPQTPLADGAEQKAFPIQPNNIHCFHGFESLLTLQHRLPFTVGGVKYESVDHFYQIAKVRDLLGVESEKFFDGSVKNYGALARELLKGSNVRRDQVDNWRTTNGLMAIQKGLLEKLKQVPALQTALVNTGEKIIAHTFAGDDFFGTGVPFKYVKDWASGMEQNKSSMKIPMSFPLTPESVKSVPVLAKGRNVLGVIYMILREKFNLGQLNSLRVDEGKDGQQEVFAVTQQLGNKLGLQQSSAAQNAPVQVTPGFGNAGVAASTRPYGVPPSSSSNIDFTMN